MSENNNTSFKNIGDFYISCPHCDDIIYITKIKCALFLHGYNSKTNKQLNPHSKWYYIDKIKRFGHLIGCGGKFKLEKDKNGLIYSIPMEDYQ